MHGFLRVTVAGDSRVVRVQQVLENWMPVSGIAEWVGSHFCIVAGSIWEADMRFLARAYEQLRGHNIRWILVPHEVSPRQIETLTRLWPVKTILYTHPEWDSTRDTLIIDTLGLLAYLYAYGHLAWIGGGFGTGIHNILEAVIYKKPVFFWPNYEEFPEARELIRSGVAESCKYPVSFSNAVKSFLKDKRRLQLIAEKAEKFLSVQPDTPTIVWNVLKNAPWLQELAS
jgi:3-deoxy-D-manno-octulosonic-acid transferase